MKIEGIVCAPFFFIIRFFSLFFYFFYYHLLCSFLWSVRMYFWCLYRRWGCFVLVRWLISPCIQNKSKAWNVLFFCVEDISLLYSSFSRQSSIHFLESSLKALAMCGLWIPTMRIFRTWFISVKSKSNSLSLQRFVFRFHADCGFFLLFIVWFCCWFSSFYSFKTRVHQTIKKCDKCERW